MRESPVQLYRNALRRVTPSLGDVAEAQGTHRNTIGMYMRDRPPSPAAVRRLVIWLRDHAKMCSDYAERLEGALGDEEETTPRTIHRRGTTKRHGRRR